MEAQISSQEARDRTSELNQRLKSLNQLKVLLLTTLEDSARSRQRQSSLVKRIEGLREAMNYEENVKPRQANG